MCEPGQASVIRLRVRSACRFLVERSEADPPQFVEALEHHRRLAVALELRLRPAGASRSEKAATWTQKQSLRFLRRRAASSGGRVLAAHDLDLDRRHAVDVETDHLCRGVREVDDPALDEGPAVVDPDLDVGAGVAAVTLTTEPKGSVLWAAVMACMS